MYFGYIQLSSIPLLLPDMQLTFLLVLFWSPLFFPFFIYLTSVCVIHVILSLDYPMKDDLPTRNPTLTENKFFILKWTSLLDNVSIKTGNTMSFSSY